MKIIDLEMYVVSSFEAEVLAHDVGLFVCHQYVDYQYRREDLSYEDHRFGVRGVVL